MNIILIILMVDFDIKPCKTRAAKKAEPHKKLKLDLLKLELPFEILARTPGMIVISVDDVVVNLYKDGSMMIQTEDALPIAEKVFKCLE